MVKNKLEVIRDISKEEMEKTGMRRQLSNEIEILNKTANEIEILSYLIRQHIATLDFLSENGKVIKERMDFSKIRNERAAADAHNSDIIKLINLFQRARQQVMESLNSEELMEIENNANIVKVLSTPKKC